MCDGLFTPVYYNISFWHSIMVNSKQKLNIKEEVFCCNQVSAFAMGFSKILTLRCLDSHFGNLKMFYVAWNSEGWEPVQIFVMHHYIYVFCALENEKNAENCYFSVKIWNLGYDLRYFWAILSCCMQTDTISSRFDYAYLFKNVSHERSWSIWSN